jgi:CheY-like chemotaxis protein
VGANGELGAAVAMATILLVEDEEPIQQFIGDLLEEEGYRVQCASDGAQALDLVADRRPDLVLTDLMMPIMNGFELCRRLKDNPVTSGIPIVVMSAVGRQQAIECDADDFLGKPFELDALLDIVARHVGQMDEKAGDRRR